MVDLEQFTKNPADDPASDTAAEAQRPLLKLI
jgi:hypothetical protein